MRNNALAVPQVAVMDGPQGKFVYVAGKDKDGKDIAAATPGRRSATGSTRMAANLWVVESGLEGRRSRDRRRRRESCSPGAPIKLGGAPPPAAPGAPRRLLPRAAKDAKRAPK